MMLFTTISTGFEINNIGSGTKFPSAVTLSASPAAALAAPAGKSDWPSTEGMGDKRVYVFLLYVS